jgi:phosphoribosylamine--glycine ligase/phosphoribosylformylglycinamidine cyclo-ligase
VTWLRDARCISAHTSNSNGLLGVQVFHAGTSIDDSGNTVTSGGRVIVVSAFAPDLRDALAVVYQGIDAIHFEGKTFRRDIAHRLVGLRLTPLLG